jgi:hypothetical protein
LITLGAGGFKSASMRGEMNRTWSKRVDLAASALDEKTIVNLELLRGEINEILPLPEDADFDPADAITDPAPLVDRAEECAKTFRARVRMASDLKWLLRLGPFLTCGLFGAAAATAGLTAFYAELLRWGWLRAVSFVALAAAVVVVLVVGVAYSLLQYRLSGDEILAGTGGKDGDGGTG